MRARRHAAILPFGVNMVAPVIMAFGNQAQKDYYLPRILNCDDWWCQGYLNQVQAQISLH
jgi:alkylation response protein AidB-like acyl-CoA dehydrogenase